jgi:RNA-directed DNA polymerase
LEIPTTEEGVTPKLAQLRAKLGMKAQNEPDFKFYTLYSHLTRMDVLETAWALVLKNRGSAGYDGMSLEDIKEGGVERFLKEVQESLKHKTYKADPIKRVYIPKSDGSMRPLGYPRSRIVLSKWH